MRFAEEMGEYLRYVVSHEMAHALGYSHNQKGSSAFPVDSLRSPAFTAEWGNSSSVVGRTRFNFGYGNDFDPYRKTESIGREWIEASELGMRNLRRVIPNLVDWVGVEGESHFEVMQRYMQVFTQWNRFVTRVTSAVGGMEEHLKVVGEEGPVYTPIPAEEQRRSVAWLDEHAYRTPEWLLGRDLPRRLEHVGAMERVRWYQVNSLNQFLSVYRLERILEQEAVLREKAYGLAEMLDDLREAVWRELASGELNSRNPIDVFRRNLQRGYLDRMGWLLKEASAEAPPPSGDYRPDLETSCFDDVELRTPFHVHQSDVVPLVWEQLHLLRDEIEAALEKIEEGAEMDGRESRAHLRHVLVRIDGMLR